MKSVIVLLIMSVINIQGFSQSQEKGLAKVMRIQGVYVYFMSEPIQEYEIVFDKNTGMKLTSILTEGLVNESINDKATSFVQKIIKEAESEGLKFDAVLYSGGKEAFAIRFKGNVKKDEGIARVNKIKGVMTFVLSEPLKDYTIVCRKSWGVKMKSWLTSGLVNNSIEEDIYQLVERLMEEANELNQQIDGMIYTSGKYAIGIKTN